MRYIQKKMIRLYLINLLVLCTSSTAHVYYTMNGVIYSQTILSKIEALAEQLLDDFCLVTQFDCTDYQYLKKLEYLQEQSTNLEEAIEIVFAYTSQDFYVNEEIQYLVCIVHKVCDLYNNFFSSINNELFFSYIINIIERLTRSESLLRLILLANNEIHSITPGKINTEI